MSQQTLNLDLPEHLSERILQAARASNRTAEAVALDILSLHYGSAVLDPDTLDFRQFTDQELWLIVHQRPSRSEETRLRKLMALGEDGQLSSQQQAEMEALVAKVNRQMLARSEALLLLKQRGHETQSYLQSRP